MNRPFKKERVARDVWLKMKKSSAMLPKGACQKCQRNTETVFPTLVDVCRACAERLMANGARLLQVKRFLRRTAVCAWCDRHVPPVPPVPAKSYIISVHLCEKCVRHWDPSGRRLHKL